MTQHTWDGIVATGALVALGLIYLSLWLCVKQTWPLRSDNPNREDSTS